MADNRNSYRYAIKEGDGHISKTISFMRFPLIVMVVFIHSYISMPYYGSNITPNMVPFFFNLEFLLSEIIACIAVPLFFLISGFLFFYKHSGFSVSFYFTKLKKRCKSLLVPYIFWNLLAILITFLIQICLPSLLSGQGSLVTSWTISDWVLAMWGGVSPHNIPLWFIRDLMIIVVFSPLVYYLIRFLKIYGIIILGGFYVLGVWVSVPGFSITSLFFFSLGAYFSINGVDFVRFSEKYIMYLTVLFVFISSVLMLNKDTSFFNVLKSVNNIVGLLMFAGLSSFFIRKNAWMISPLLISAGFFVYAYHGIFSERVLRFLFLLLNPSSELCFTCIYFSTALLLIVGGIVLYAILNKLLPKFTSFITGSR